MILKKHLLSLAVAAALPAFAMAQPVSSADVSAAPSKTQQPMVSPVPSPDTAVINSGALHFGVDLNVATSYFFRGYNQEDTGFIFQPNVYGTVDFLQNVDPSSTVSAATLKIGSWNSFHSEQTASDDAWYESDIYGVFTMKFMNTYYASVGYTFYTYPGDAFDTIQELGVSGGMSDLTGLWDKSTDKTFTMPVEVGFYKETEDGNGDEDFYAELKVTPTLATTYDMIPGFGKATISFPLILGTSLDGYYLDSDGDNEFFGYVQGGVNVGLPMTFVPAQYGTWTLNAGVNYIQMLADSAEFANDGGEEYEVQGLIGVSMAY